MTTREQIIEAMARAVAVEMHGDDTDQQDADHYAKALVPALNAALPLIQQALAEMVREHHRSLLMSEPSEAHYGLGLLEAARLIEASEAHYRLGLLEAARLIEEGI